jgi:hypothetical protein
VEKPKGERGARKIERIEDGRWRIEKSILHLLSSILCPVLGVRLE